MIILALIGEVTCKSKVQKTVKEKKTPMELVANKEKKQDIKQEHHKFKPDAIITMSNGKIYEVEDFAFYSYHGTSSGFYYPSSGYVDNFYYVKKGPIWKRYDLKKIKSITFLKSTDDSDWSWGWLKTNIVMLDGTSLQGLHPIGGYLRTWYPQGVFYLSGESKILNKSAEFKCELENISKIERLDSDSKTLKFRITYEEKNQTTIWNAKFELIWENDKPVSLDKYTLEDEMQIEIQKMKVKIKPREIELVKVPQEKFEINTDTLKVLNIIVKMKKGQTVKTELPWRIFGKLKNGDILFTEMYYCSNYPSSCKSVVKSIQIN